MTLLRLDYLVYSLSNCAMILSTETGLMDPVLHPLQFFEINHRVRLMHQPPALQYFSLTSLQH